MEKHSFDFSKPADQQKFERLQSDEKEAEINRANDEAIEIKKESQRSLAKKRFQTPQRTIQRRLY